VTEVTETKKNKGSSNSAHLQRNSWLTPALGGCKLGGVNRLPKRP